MRLPKYEIPKYNKPNYKTFKATAPNHPLPKLYLDRDGDIRASVSYPIYPEGYGYVSRAKLKLKSENKSQPKKSKTFIADYNNPTQINSIADVLFAKNKWNALKKLVGNTINYDMWTDSSIDGLTKAKILGNNALVAFSETMDTLSNPIKGLIIDGPEGWNKALGNADAGGRTNYEYNFGEGFWWGAAELAAEVFSDPIVWATIAYSSWGKAVVGGVVKGAAGPALKDSVKASVKTSFKTMGREVADDVASEIAEKAIKKAAKTTITELREDATTKYILKNIPDKALRTREAQALYTQRFTKNITKDIAQRHGLKGHAIDTFIDSLTHSKAGKADFFIDKKTANILQSLSKVRDFTNTVDHTMLKTAFYSTSPVAYPVTLLVRKVAKKWSPAVGSALKKKLSAVLSSPILYQAADALSTIRLIASEISKDTELQEVLRLYNCGEITTRDLGDWLCVSVGEHTASIRAVLKKKSARALKKGTYPTDTLEVVNKMLNAELGVNSLDEYIETLSSLKGHVSTSSEKYIDELIELREEIAYLDAKNTVAMEYETKIQRLKTLEEQKTILKSSPTPKDALKGTVKFSDETDAALQLITNAKANINYTGAYTAYRRLAYDLTPLISKCTNVTEVKAIFKAFEDYTRLIKPYVVNKHLLGMGTDTVQRLYDTALDAFWNVTQAKRTVSTTTGVKQEVNVIQGFERFQHAATLKSFTADNIKASIDIRVYRSFLEATRNNLTKRERLNYIRNNVNRYIDNLLNDFHNVNINFRNITDLADATQAFKLDLQNQITKVFDELSDSTRTSGAIERALHNKLKINTTQFDEVFGIKFKEVTKEIKQLKAQISVLEASAQTIEQVSKATTKQLEDATALGTVRYEIAKRLETDVKRSDSLTVSLEEMNMAPKDFKKTTDAVIKWLGKEFNDYLATYDLAYTARNLTDNAIEALRNDVDEACRIIDEFATGTPVLYSDLAKARHTLLEVANLRMLQFDDFKTVTRLDTDTYKAYFNSLRNTLDLSADDKIALNFYEEFYEQYAVHSKKHKKVLEKKFDNKLRLKYEDAYNGAQIAAIRQNYLDVEMIKFEATAKEAAFSAKKVKAKYTRAKNLCDKFDNMHKAAHREAKQSLVAPIIDYTEIINPARIRTEQVRIAADAVYYTLKGEQLVNIMTYLSDEHFVEAVASMCDVSSPFYTVLNIIANDATNKYSRQAQQLIYSAENFLQYIKTHNKIMQLGTVDHALTLEEVTALRSTIEKFARTPLHSAEANFDELMDNIIKETEKYYNYSYVWKESFSQDKILARNPAYALEDGITDYYHRADTDAEATAAIRRRELGIPEELKDRPKVYIDIETTDLSDRARIVEIGTYSEAGRKLYKRMYSSEAEAALEVPVPSALAKSYSGYDGYDAQAEAFIKEHLLDAAATPQTAKEYYETFLLQLFNEGDDTVIIGHNIIEFDKPKLLAAFQDAGVRKDLIAKFENATFLDNLVDLRKKAGYVTFSADKQDAIKRILKDHIDDTLRFGDSDYFFDAGIKSMREQLTVLIKDLDETAPGLGLKFNNDFVYKSGKTLKRQDSSLGLLNTFKTYVEDLRKKFTQAASNTVSVQYAKGLPILSKTALTNLPVDLISDEFKAFIKNHFDGDLDAYIQALGSDPTLTKFLNDSHAAKHLTANTDVTPVNFWGYKKIADINKVNDWFTISAEDGYADLWRMQMYTKIGNHLDNLSSSLRNVPQLQSSEFVVNLRSFIKEVQEAIKSPKSQVTAGKASVWIECLRTDRVDSIGNLAVGIKLYDKVKTTLPADMLVKYDEVIQVLSSNKPSKVLAPYKVPSSVIDYTDALKALKDSTNLNDALCKMELKLGAANVFTAKTQFLNNSLKNTYEYVARKQAYVNGLSQKALTEYKEQNIKNLDKLFVHQTARILQQTPEELQSFMIYHRAPLLFFDKDNIELTALAKQLVYNEALYKNYSIEFFDTKDSFYIYFTPGTKLDYYVDDLGFHASFNTDVLDLKYDSKLGLNMDLFGEDAKELNALFKQMGEITNGQSIGHVGIQLSDEMVEEYFSRLPKELQTKLNLAELKKSTMSLGFRFDAMNIGSLASRQRYNEYIPSDITRLIANANPKIIAKANESNLMLDYYLNSDLRISKLVKQYGKSAKSVIEEKVKSKDYKVLALVQDVKLQQKGIGFHGQGYKVLECTPKNKKLWDTVMDTSNDFDAILVPSYMYAEIYDKLNSSLLMHNPVYNVAHKFIYLTKLGLISTTGAVIRNIIEVQLKTMTDTKNALDVAKNDFIAIKNHALYKKAVCDIIDMSSIDYDKLVSKGIDPAEFTTKYINNRVEAEYLVQQYYTSLQDVLKMDSTRAFLTDNKQLYFKQINKAGLDENTFDIMHAILTESGALGQLSAWNKYTLNLHKIKQARFVKEYSENLIGNKMIDKKSGGQIVYDTLAAFGSMLLTPMQYVDQVGRIAHYLTLVDSGLVNPGSALSRVSRVMFDFNTKSDTEKLIELAIPFYTYFKHNAIHWAEAMGNNPWLAKLFSDYIDKLHDESALGTVSDFERAHNGALYQTRLAGNLIMSSSNEHVERKKRTSKKGNDYYVDVIKHKDQVTLKLNNPIMEAYSFISTPISSLMGATNPIIQLALQSWIGNNTNVPNEVADILGVYRPYNLEEIKAKDPDSLKLHWYDYMTVVPYAGPVFQRWGPEGYAKKAYDETGFLGNLILPSVFGKLNRFDGDSEFVGMVNQYPSYNRNYRAYKKSYGPKQYGRYTKYYSNSSKPYVGPVKTRTAYTKVKKAKIKTYNPNYYNQYNYNLRVYSNPYNYNKKQTYYTNKTKYYPQRLPKRPKPSVYQLLYNPYGKSRLQYLGLPKTVKNTSNALRKMFNYTR